MITIIILLFIPIWYLWGFSPKRRLDRRNNYWQAWGIGKWIIGFIDGDKGIIPWVSMPWPFGPIESPERWNQFETDGSRDKNSLGYEIKKGKELSIENISKIIEYSDKSSYVRKLSRFIFIADINFPISGLGFTLVLPTIFKIFNPKKRIPLGSNTLGYTQGEVGDSFDPWFVKEEQKWKEEYDKLTNPDMSFGIYVFQKMEGFRIDDIEKNVFIQFDQVVSISNDGTELTESKSLSFRKYLETQKLRKFGIKFGELSLQLGYKQSVIDLLKERSKMQEIAEQQNTANQNEKLRVIKRKTQVNDAQANADATSKEWIIQKEILQETALAQAIVNESWSPEVLVLGNDQNNLLTQSMIGGFISGKKTKKQGGSDEQE